MEPGQAVELVCAPSAKSAGIVPVPHQDFFQAALSSDGTIVLNDARIVLAVEKADALTLQARVVSGGEISSRKGITCSSTSFRRESLGEKDIAILNLTKGMDGVRYAVSYVKDAQEMALYRTMTGDGAYVAAKLERKDALEGVAGIASFSDELWLCRGDLGPDGAGGHGRSDPPLLRQGALHFQACNPGRTGSGAHEDISGPDPFRGVLSA